VTTPTTPLTVHVDDPAIMEYVQKMRDLYSSCMNETQIELLGREPLLQQIEELLQIFPVPGSAIATSLVFSRSRLEVPVMTKCLLTEPHSTGQHSREHWGTWKGCTLQA